jgi:pimeloyl-ACP methyl ester carboxylesterase
MPSRISKTTLRPTRKEWAALGQKMPPGLQPHPVCALADTSTFAAFRTTRACALGFAIPESELRNQFENVNGGVGPVKSPDWVMRAIGQRQVFRKDYSNIRVPVLVLLPGYVSEYQPKSDEERVLIEQFVARGRVIIGRWIDKLKRHVPDARVVEVPGGGHYLWMTREAEVLREIHAFIAGLPADAQKR